MNIKLSNNREFINTAALAVVMITILCVLTAIAWGADYRYKQNMSSTEISIHDARLLQAKVLGAADPTQKIVIKLSGRGNLIDQNSISGWQIPQQSGIAGLRVIPYSENRLLIVELLDALTYQFLPEANGFRLVIHDADFRNPTEYLYRKGLYHHNRGELKKALSYYRRVALGQRGHAYAYYKAGQIRMNWKDYRKAEINLRKALYYGCDSSGVYNALAELYQRTGKTKLADEYRRKYRSLLPGQAPLKSSPSPTRRIRRRNRLVDNTAADSTGQMANIREATNPEKSGAIPPWLRDYRFLLALMIALTTVAILFALYRLLLRIPGKKSARKRVAATRTTLPEKEVPPPQPAAPTTAQKTPAPEPQVEQTETATPQAVVARVRDLDPQEMERIGETLFRLVNLSKPDDDSEGEELIGEGLPQVFSPRDALLRKRFQEWEQQQKEESSSTGNRAVLPVDEQKQADIPEEESTRNIAKKLHIGVGELELALNLSAQQDPATTPANPRELVTRLAAQNLSIEEIARRTRLGSSEVEMLLKLNRAR